jgi:hypothetical protein
MFDVVRLFTRPGYDWTTDACFAGFINLVAACLASQ